MTASTAPNAPLRYRGYNSQYVDIAVRGADEHLGLAIEYAAHPSGIGCFIVRFIAHGKGVDPKSFKHLTYRESAKFLIPPTEGNPTPEIFKGLRLTKVAIPVFKPAIQRHEVAVFGDQFNVWPQVAGWVVEQATTEGFTITVPNLESTIRDLVVLPTTAPGTVESVLDFPKLDAPEQKAAALKLVKNPEPEEVDDEEDGEESDDKEWLN